MLDFSNEVVKDTDSLSHHNSRYDSSVFVRSTKFHVWQGFQIFSTATLVSHIATVCLS
jgi:hypothetical protein